jgi:hypothetical protein
LQDPIGAAFDRLIARNGPEFVQQKLRHGLPTSIDELEWGSPILTGLSSLKISSPVKVHSIIADRHNPARVGGADGLVPCAAGGGFERLETSQNHGGRHRELPISRLVPTSPPLFWVTDMMRRMILPAALFISLGTCLTGFAKHVVVVPPGIPQKMLLQHEFIDNTGNVLVWKEIAPRQWRSPSGTIYHEMARGYKGLDIDMGNGEWLHIWWHGKLELHHSDRSFDEYPGGTLYVR